MHVAYLEVDLKLGDDGNELFVELAVRHDELVERLRLEDFDHLGDEVCQVGLSGVGRLEDRVAHIGQVLKAQGALPLDQLRGEAVEVRCHELEQVLHE